MCLLGEKVEVVVELPAWTVPAEWAEEAPVEANLEPTPEAEPIPA